MTNRLEMLEDWATGLLRQLDQVSRKKLALNLGHELRRSQQRRITAQKNLDGNRYAPRKKNNLQYWTGKLKRKGRMFQSLRTRRLLKTKVNDNKIMIGFTQQTAQIARVHQFGLRERNIIHKRREILGLTDFDITLIRSELIKHVIHNQKQF